ncbi:MAG: family 10 glycosylhydrolase [Breznakibacter sp.]
MLKLGFFSILALIPMVSFSQKTPKYEMRGLWVATVKNIDWPSKPDLPGDEQQKEAIAILDNARSLNFNAIFLQIRPASDAFYQSSLEPMSMYLTGTSGQNPNPFYDPLAFWIEQAHARGLELHAWINPYRGNMSVNDKLDGSHPINQRPGWFISYNGRQQYDPGNPECREHIAAVVDEIVANYSIDGIHLDDYFYPYPKAGEEFNDTATFARYNPKNLSKPDWRRENVDQTIQLLQHTIKNRKPYLPFGVSPFGVWRNKADDLLGSDTRAGITNYDMLYADILLWLREGWIDYVAPQIYWDTEHPTANYKVLAEWWDKNSYGKSVFIGHSLYRVNQDPAPWDSPSQLLKQIRISRLKPNVYGSIFFSANHLTRNLQGLQDSLQQDTYKYPALVPPTVEKEKGNHSQNPIIVKKVGKKLKWKNPNKQAKLKYYVVYAYENLVSNPENDAAHIMATTTKNHMELDKHLYKGRTVYFKVSAIDEYNYENALSYPRKVTFK